MTGRYSSETSTLGGPPEAPGVPQISVSSPFPWDIVFLWNNCIFGSRWCEARGRCLLPPHDTATGQPRLAQLTSQMPLVSWVRPHLNAPSHSTDAKWRESSRCLHDASSNMWQKKRRVTQEQGGDGWRRPWQCDVTESVLGPLLLLLTASASPAVSWQTPLWSQTLTLCHSRDERCNLCSDTDRYVLDICSIKCEHCQLILVPIRNPAQGRDTLAHYKLQDIFGFEFPQDICWKLLGGQSKKANYRLIGRVRQSESRQRRQKWYWRWCE